MQVYNYASFARVFELGVPNPNMTKIAKALFEPVINLEGVVNRVGNLYTIDSKMAKAWYDQTADIPPNIKEASGRDELVNSIGDYFADKIIDVITNQMKEKEMYDALAALIRSSDLNKDDAALLLDFYNDREYPDFLGRAFLYSLVGDNLKKSPDLVEEPIDADIRTFKELIKKNHKKPKSIDPPTEIENHEIKYVQELYRVYSEMTGEEYARPEDLDAAPGLRKNFNRQRKNYYQAETIRRELRDTIRIDEAEGFDILKDEICDGVAVTMDKDYDTGFDRMTAVTDKASGLPISHNLEDRMLDWVGPGEKIGVCHMLVNDDRLSWMEDEDE